MLEGLNREQLQGILDALPVEILFRFKELEKIADEKKDAYKLLP